MQGEQRKVDFTSCGVASPQHLAVSCSPQKPASVDARALQGCGDALTGVLGGQVPVFISTVAHFNPQIKNGKLRATRSQPLAQQFRAGLSDAAANRATPTCSSISGSG